MLLDAMQVLQSLVRISSMDQKDAEEEICKGRTGSTLPPGRRSPAMPPSLIKNAPRNVKRSLAWALWSTRFLKMSRQEQEVVIDTTAWRITEKRQHAVTRSWRRYLQHDWHEYVEALKALASVRITVILFSEGFF